MNITKVISPRGCANGACPSLLVTDAGTVIIQGAKLPAERRESLRIPGHEDIVSIPREVFEDLLSQYRPSPDDDQSGAKAKAPG